MARDGDVVIRLSLPLCGPSPSRQPGRLTWGAVAALLLAGIPLDAQAAPDSFQVSATQVPLANGIDVWSATAPGDTLMCVRLEADVGLGDEGPGSYGMAAAFGADLLAGATLNLSPGGTLKLGLDEALVPKVHLDMRTTALTLCGDPAAFERAIWLAGERVATAMAKDGPTSAGTKAGYQAVSSAVWEGARASRYDAVGRQGDALDTAVARALGPSDGNNAFISRLNASKASPTLFDRFVRRARSFARFRVVVTGPLTADTVTRLVRRHLGPIVSNRPSKRPLKAMTSNQDRRRFRMRHQRDASHIVVAAWDLRGVERLTGFSRVKNDAALFALYQFLDRADTLAGALIDNHQLARQVSTRLATDDNASLAIEVEARSRDTREVEKLALDEVSRLAKAPLTEDQVRSVATSLIVDMRLRWSLPLSRAALVSDLIGSARVRTSPTKGPSDAPESIAQWWAAFELELGQLTPAALQSFAGFALTDDRRVVVTMLPSRLAEPEMELTEAIVDTYRRIVVDVRCRTWGEQPSLTEVMTKKYGWTAARYIAVTRAMTRQRPGLMRSMISEADAVCGEWKRLSSLVKTRARAIDMHRAVACGPAQIRDHKRRDSAMDKVFGRLKLDISIYRPLIRMLREDVAAMAAVKGIDARCKPRYGPAVP